MCERVPLSAIAEVNPALEVPLPPPDDWVSFVPMADVSETGRWVSRQSRRVRDIGAGYTPFREHDVLFAKITPCMENGKGCLAEELVNGIGFGSTEFHVLRARDENDPRFLFYWSCLPELRQKAEAYMTGSAGQRRVAAEFFDAYRVPPLPPDAQRNASGVLARVDGAIEHTERVIEKLKKIRIGLLHDLLTRGIDENGELRDPEVNAELFHEVPGFGMAPKEWEPCHLVQYVAFPVGQVDPRLLPYRKWPLIAPDHIEEGTGRLLGIVSAEDQGAISGKYVFESGDVVYSKIRPYLRKAVLAEMQGLCSADMYPLRPTERIASRYLLMIILGERYSRFAEAVSMRSGFPKINREEMAGYQLALAQPDEQCRAVAVFEGLDTRMRREEAALRKLNMLKHGLMQDLLTGRKRVPAELIGADCPADEGGKQREANIYFKRSVLAAEIVEQFHELPTFGRVKFHKTMFLCERVAEFDLGTQYHRAAAGPYDNRFMRSVDSQMERQGWFRRVSRGTGPDGKPMGWAYQPMEKAGGHREWFERYWAEARERIQRVMDLLRGLDTERCEIIATLYSAWEDLLAAGGDVADEAIVNEVLTNWHESKQAIPRDRWMGALGWMRERGLTPVSGSTGGA